MKAFVILSVGLVAASMAAVHRPSQRTSYADQVIALDEAGTCDDVEKNDNCGDDASSYYEEYLDGDYRYVIISGAPNHDAEYNQTDVNPNTRCERWQFVKLPTTFATRANIDRYFGTTGFVMSGAVVYDDRSTEAGDIAENGEWESLDPSHGHSSPNKQYHYHGWPAEYSDANDASACEQIGYMLDGRPLYSLCEVDGVELTSCYKQIDDTETPSHENDYEYDSDSYGSTCFLDKANMYDFGGSIGEAYVLTRDFPYVPYGTWGEMETPCGFTPS